MAKDLLSSSSSSEEEAEELTLNKEYAKEYEYRKHLQELRESKDDLSDDGSDSSSSEEDEDAELLTPEKDLKIWKLLKAIKNKDDAIYNSQTEFFKDDDSSSSSSSSSSSGYEKKKKSMKVKDVLRREIVEQMDSNEAKDLSSSDDEEQSKNVWERSTKDLCYNEEQELLRKDFLNQLEDDEDDVEDSLLVQKQTKHSKQDNESLLKEEEMIVSEWKQRSSDKPTLVDPHGDIENGDLFLLEYISKKKWIDPTDTPSKPDDDEDSLEDLEKQEHFESQYNFRFEESTPQIASFSRTTQNSLRAKTKSRKAARESRKERKRAERKAKEETLKRLKNAKRLELRRRLRMIEEAAGPEALEGVDEKVWDDLLLNDDWDEGKFEEVMRKVYDDGFYGEEGERVVESREEILKGMDEFLDEDLVQDEEEEEEQNYDYQQSDNHDNEEEEKEEQSYDCQQNDNHDTPIDMDNHHQEDQIQTQQNTISTTQKLNTKIEEELYKLDYEDMIGDMPCRFKYKTVTPNDYGLSCEEILLSRDTTLKQYVSLKKMAPFGEEQEGEYRPSYRQQKRFQEMFACDYEEFWKKKRDLGVKVFPKDRSMVDLEQERNGMEGDDPNKKKKRRRQKKKKKNDDTTTDDNNEHVDSNDNDNELCQDNNHLDQSSAELPNNDKNTKEENLKGETRGPVDANAGTTKRKRKKKGKKLKKNEKRNNADMTMALKVKDPQDDSDNKTENVTFDEKDTKNEKHLDENHVNKRKKRKKTKIHGVSASRLASYGL